MDAMALAQMKRQMAWQVEETKKIQHELHTSELLLETTKKKVEELRHKFTDNKRKVDQYTVETQKAEDQLRKETFKQSRQ